MAGNIGLSAYTAAAANCLTTELNSLADGNVSALGSEVDNTSSLDDTADFQIDLASLTISSTTAQVSIFIVPTVDGTNYPDFSSGAYGNYHAQYLAATGYVKNVSATTARADITGVPIGPGKFKVALRDQTGAALAASGNTVKIRTYKRAYT